jgi:23S rRNA pseudouridine2605 synthase
VNIERLHKLIARSGFASRRKAELLISQGRVTVDGSVAHIGQQIDPEFQSVAIDGVVLPVAPGLVYYLLNKPRGVVSTADDPEGRPIVVGLVPAEPRVFPIGRLDVDSEGLLILTNDGDLTLRLTHPRYGIEKTYVALVDGHPGKAALRRLTSGVELDDGMARAVRARVLDRRGGESLVEIVMAEGRKREVRRMCDAVAHPVHRLVRTGIGPLRDAALRPGAWRPLTLDEVRGLYGAAGSDIDAPESGGEE